MARTKKSMRAAYLLMSGFCDGKQFVDGLQKLLYSGDGTTEELLSTLSRWPNIPDEDQDKAKAWVGMKRLEKGILDNAAKREDAPDVDELTSQIYNIANILQRIPYGTPDFVVSRFFLSVLSEFADATKAKREIDYSSINRDDTRVQFHDWFDKGTWARTWFTANTRPSTPVPKILLRPRDQARRSPLDRKSNKTPGSGSQREAEAGPSNRALSRKRSQSQSTLPADTDSEVDQLESDMSEDEVENVRTADAKLDVKGKGKAQGKGVKRTVKREASEDTAAPLERPAKKARVTSPVTSPVTSAPLRKIKLPVDEETKEDLLRCDRCKAGGRKCVRSTRWPCDDCAGSKMKCSRSPANAKKGWYITENEELQIRISKGVPVRRPYGPLPNIPQGFQLSKEAAHKSSAAKKQQRKGKTPAPALPPPSGNSTDLQPFTSPVVPNERAKSAPPKTPGKSKRPVTTNAPRPRQRASIPPQLGPLPSTSFNHAENDRLTRLEKMITQMVELSVEQQAENRRLRPEVTGMQTCMQDMMGRIVEQKAATDGLTTLMEGQRKEIMSLVQAMSRAPGTSQLPINFTSVGAQVGAMNLVDFAVQHSPDFISVGIQSPDPVDMNVDMEPNVTAANIQAGNPAGDLNADEVPSNTAEDNIPMATAEGGVPPTQLGPPQVCELNLEDDINCPSPLTSLPGQDEDDSAESPGAVSIVENPADKIDQQPAENGPRRSTRRHIK